jgi:type IV pilus assembly protein PilX
MKPHPLISAFEHSRQRGAALLTALVFLVVLTLLGIGVYSTTTSEEKMARNFRDKEIALQSAEAALNEAKMLINGSYDSLVTSNTKKPLSEDRCYQGTTHGFSCDRSINASTIDLFAGSGTGAQMGSDSTSSVGTALSPGIVGLNIQPRYLVIWQRPDVCGTSNTGHCFQIIAQGRGRLPNTRVNLVELFTY